MSRFLTFLPLLHLRFLTSALYRSPSSFLTCHRFGGNGTNPNELTRQLMQRIVERTSTGPDRRSGGGTVWALRILLFVVPVSYLCSDSTVFAPDGPAVAFDLSPVCSSTFSSFNSTCESCLDGWNLSHNIVHFRTRNASRESLMLFPVALHTKSHSTFSTISLSSLWTSIWRTIQSRLLGMSWQRPFDMMAGTG